MTRKEAIKELENSKNKSWDGMPEAREVKPNITEIKIWDNHMYRHIYLNLPEWIDTDTILRNIGVSLLNMVDANTDKIDSDMILDVVDKIAVELDEY